MYSLTLRVFVVYCVSAVLLLGCAAEASSNFHQNVTIGSEASPTSQSCLFIQMESFPVVPDTGADEDSPVTFLYTIPSACIKIDGDTHLRLRCVAEGGIEVQEFRDAFCFQKKATFTYREGVIYRRNVSESLDSGEKHDPLAIKGAFRVQRLDHDPRVAAFKATVGEITVPESQRALKYANGSRAILVSPPSTPAILVLHSHSGKYCNGLTFNFFHIFREGKCEHLFGKYVRIVRWNKRDKSHPVWQFYVFENEADCVMHLENEGREEQMKRIPFKKGIRLRDRICRHGLSLFSLSLR